MQMFRCFCGKVRSYGTDYPHPCQGCRECQTTLTQSPNHHVTPKNHIPKPVYSTADGSLSHYQCATCMTRVNENGEEQEANAEGQQ
jgi:hypothetical protein